VQPHAGKYPALLHQDGALADNTKDEGQFKVPAKFKPPTFLARF